MEDACQRVGGRVHSGKCQTPKGKTLMTDMKDEETGDAYDIWQD